MQRRGTFGTPFAVPAERRERGFTAIGAAVSAPSMEHSEQRGTEPSGNGRTRRIASLAELVRPDGDPRYDLLLCDVWGVVHDGVRAIEPSVKALVAARAAGASVVLITNSPRPSEGVREQLASLHVPDDAYDAIVTSGDVTRGLMRSGPRDAFHLGPERDLPLYEGTGVRPVPEEAADVVVCTGLFDDENETAADYAPMLRRFHERGLPMIVANPDIVVERGDRLIPCAGALGRDYERMGGRTLIAGKPHGPIYDAAFTLGAEVMGRALDPARILAIGDGMPTDIRGALNRGLDVLFVAGGIHVLEYGGDRIDRAGVDAFLAANGADMGRKGAGRVVAWIERLA